MIRRPLVKFCGMTNGYDVRRATRLGVSAIGFVFWSGSPRVVTPQRAREMVATLPAFVVPVGVFVDEPVEKIREVVEFVGLGAVQLHGHEDPMSVVSLTTRVIKAIGEPGSDVLAEALQWTGNVTLLIDSLDAKRRGGTGKLADWSVARAIAEKRNVVLAGGLRAENIEEAITHVKPYGVDVSSGIEREHDPLTKDFDRMRAFMDAVDVTMMKLSDDR